jgi:hypothetical protein
LRKSLGEISIHSFQLTWRKKHPVVARFLLYPHVRGSVVLMDFLNVYEMSGLMIYLVYHKMRTTFIYSWYLHIRWTLADQ